MNTACIAVDEFRKLRAANDKVAFITISQSTRDCKMRGSNEIADDAGIVTGWMRGGHNHSRLINIEVRSQNSEGACLNSFDLCVNPRLAGRASAKSARKYKNPGGLEFGICLFFCFRLFAPLFFPPLRGD